MESFFKFEIWYFPKQNLYNQRSYWFCINYKNLSFAGHWKLAFDPDSHMITKLNTCQYTVSFASKVGYKVRYLWSMYIWGPAYSSYYGIIRTVMIWMWNVPSGLVCLSICLLEGGTLFGDCRTFGARVLAGSSEPLEQAPFFCSATLLHYQAPRSPTPN